MLSTHQAQGLSHSTEKEKEEVQKKEKNEEEEKKTGNKKRRGKCNNNEKTPRNVKTTLSHRNCQTRFWGELE